MFEKIELLHRLYPPYLLGARMAAWLFYEDHDAHNFVMLQGLHWKVDQLSKRMEMMAEANVVEKQASGAGCCTCSTAVLTFSQGA